MKYTAPLLAMIALITFTNLPDAHAGAWTQPTGECYAKIWSTALVGSAAFGLEDETFETESYKDFALAHYIECGVAPKWTVLTSGEPIGWAEYDSERALYTGRLGLGVRRGFLDGPLRLALEADWGHQGLVGDEELAVTEPFSFRPVHRSHTLRAGGSIGYGRSTWWITADVGYRYFSARELSGAIVGNLQVGWKPLDALVLDLHLPLHLQTQAIDTNNISGAGNTNYLGLGLGASWWFNDFVAVNVGFDGVVFARANAATPAVQLGVELRPTLFAER